MVSTMDHRKILVLRLSSVGDVIRTLPAVKTLKDHYPSSHITWIVEEPSRTLLESQPEIDEVIVFPRKRWTEGVKSAKGLWKTMGEARRFVSDLRKRQFDVAIDFHGILKSGILCFLSGSLMRIGFDRKSGKEGNFLFSNVKISLPDERMSRFQSNFALLKPLGLEVKTLNPRLHIPAKDQEYVGSFFDSLPPSHKGLRVAIHPGTSPKISFKRWMPERYSQLADRLVRELKATVIFTWGPGELSLVENIRERMTEPSVAGPATESLMQLAEVFKRCSVYVGGDTGPMYLASLVGTPIVVVYGPTDPVLYEPLGLCRKVMKEVGCNPCYPGRKRSCRELNCLKMVTVDDVFKATKEILSLSD
jgi:lipopolysaccharide heptosyltransferase II